VIEHALARGDSVAARRLLNAFDTLAGSTSTDRAFRIAYPLVFGDSNTRARSHAALDTCGSRVLESVSATFVDEPKRAVLQAELSRLRRSRPDATPGLAVTAARDFARAGRIHEARSRLHDQLNTRPIRASIAFELLNDGAPTDAELEHELALTQTDSLGPGGLLYIGAHAADQGRWPDHARAIALANEKSGKVAQAGDTVRARYFAGASRGLQGYGELRQHQADAGINDLQAAQRLLVGSGPNEHANETLRRWIGEAHAEAGRVDDAIRWYRSLPNPLDRLRLGELYARAGQREDARAAFAEFLDVWRAADPSLPQPLRARKALLGLSPDRPR
jgi:tetratricopeptide (TPR) repeat protein